MTDPKPNADALAKELKKSLAKRRPRQWQPVVALLIVATLLLGLLAWWLVPTVPLPMLQVTALDAVFTSAETPMARAQLYADPNAERARSLSGQAVVFRTPGESVLKSDERGQAAIEVNIRPKQEVAEFLVRHFEVGRQLQGGVPVRGRVCVWPKESPLLIVDVDETLIAKELDAKAAATLKKAAAEGWRIVYVSPAAGHADDFHKARAWIDTHPNLPDGPVLGRSAYPSDASVEQARREILQALVARFTGAHAAIVGGSSAAQTSKDLGLRTFLIGSAKAPAEVAQVPSWADIRLKR